MKILITGGFGFIGSHLIKKLLLNKKNYVLNIDSKSYASMPESLKNYNKNDKYNYKNISITNFSKISRIIKNYQPNLIFHLAAESHVDNSINNPNHFIQTNINGTYNLLNACVLNIKRKDNFKFIHISTDEVYGSLKNKNDKSFTENSKFLPNSPYSASKASSDLLVRAWNKTYKLKTIITNCVNNYGPWQFPEKLIPVIIYSCLCKKKIPVYGNGSNIREWIHVNDHVETLINISKKGKIGETYNIGSGIELNNINLVHKICDYFDKKYPIKYSYKKLITFVKDRPAHDFRYSINSDKVKKIVKINNNSNFDTKLNETIDWYIDNKKWLINKIRSL